MKALTLILTLVLSFNLKAQTDDQFDKQIEEILKAREEILKSLMDDSSMGDFESRMQEMMKRFAGLIFDLSGFESPIIGSYDWVVTDTQKILKLKVQQAKDHPLDIKIEQGMIKIKGDIVALKEVENKKVTRKSTFERTFSLPDDVDQTNPEFENKAGELLIKFKKLAATKIKSQVPSKKVQLPDPKKERLPVAPETDDLKI